MARNACDRAILDYFFCIGINWSINFKIAVKSMKSVAVINDPGSRIAVVGVGISGKAIIRFLLSAICNVKPEQIVVFDENLNNDARQWLLVNYPGIKTCFGVWERDTFVAFDLVLLSPGISLFEPAIVAAQAQGVLIDNDLGLFCAYKPDFSKTIGVTGTNGKTTAVTFLHEVAKCAGLAVNYGGNIGIALLDLLLQQLINKEQVDWYILELSSFQLAQANYLSFDIGCILNITPDHLTWHKTMEHYIASKQRLVTASTSVIKQENTYSALAAFKLAPAVIAALDNIESMCCIAQKMGVAAAQIAAVCHSFAGLEHRMEPITISSGSMAKWWFNDSKATNPAAASHALTLLVQSEDFLSVNGNIVWLAGGQAKSNDFSWLDAKLLKKLKLSVLFGDAASDFNHRLNQLGIASCIVPDLEGAVALAAAISNSADVVLFSPACASFDSFASFAERGTTFKKYLSLLS